VVHNGAIEEPQRPVERAALVPVIGGGNLIAHKDAGFRLQCAAMPQVPHLGFLAVDQGFGKRVGRLLKQAVQMLLIVAVIEVDECSNVLRCASACGK